MITLETVVALAIRNREAMDELGAALRSDLVLANPYYRRLVEFADDFLNKEKHLPQPGDWDIWRDSLDEGMER